MPRLQDIERFKRDLAALSHEAEVLERWGEKPAVISPPESVAAAPGPDAPSQEPEKTSSAQMPRPSPSPEDEGLPPDFAALLNDLPVDRESPVSSPASMDDELAALLGPTEEEAEAEPEGEASSEAEPFDLESFGTQSFEPMQSEAEPSDFALPDFPGTSEAPEAEVSVEAPEEAVDEPIAEAESQPLFAAVP